MNHDTALVFVDLQLDYFPGGRWPLAGADAAVAAAARVLADVRQAGRPVFHVRQQSVHPGAAFLIKDSPGTALHPAVAPRPGERVIDKHRPNAFAGTTLEADLRAAGVNQLVFAGMMTSMCIDASVRHASDVGFACTLIANACATAALTWQGRTVPAEDVHAAFVAALAAGYARVVDSEVLRG